MTHLERVKARLIGSRRAVTSDRVNGASLYDDLAGLVADYESMIKSCGQVMDALGICEHEREALQTEMETRAAMTATAKARVADAVRAVRKPK
jgi:hypothetical protein